MKFRKFLLTLRLWARCIRARRTIKRITKKFLYENQQLQLEIKALTRHYEKQLAVERARNETVHTAWADRWLQREKLATLSISTGLIDEKAEAKLRAEVILEREESLNSAQILELQERKDQFFQDGYELKKSYAEINNRWNDIKEDVIQDIRMAVN